ncbi:MAG: hypothetical protein GY841_06440 [FCB group bacterium]|nr:hypothetical protein [FCB group bacterium]
MRRLVIVAPVFLLLIFAGIVNAQDIRCDGRSCGGTGIVSYDGIVRDFVYRVTTGAVPQNPDTIFIGTHDTYLSHYSDICHPAGWTYTIIPGTRPDHSGPTPHGSVSPGPTDDCSYTFIFYNISGAPLSSTSADFGFNYDGYPHDVDWTVAAFPSVSADWSAPVGMGAGPVHGPRCDTLCESGLVHGWFQPAGISDKFDATVPEPSSPSVDLLIEMGNISAGADPFFDSNTMDRCFGHTFTGWDAHCCIVSAELCFRLTPIGDGSQNDNFLLRQNETNTIWAAKIGYLKSYLSGDPADTLWAVGDTLDICLNLADLPLMARGPAFCPTNILATLQDGDLDIIMQDDTKIDFLDLTMQICMDCDTGACCLPDGSCVFAVGWADCDAISGGLGTFYPHAGCTPNPCGGNCVKPPPHLLSWWPLNETAPPTSNDIVSNRDGVHFNNPGFVTGKVGGAYRFTRMNGTGVVRVNDDPFDYIGTGDFTIDAWIYPEAWSTWCQNATCVTNGGFHPCENRIIVDNRVSRWGPGIRFFVNMDQSTPGYLGLEMVEQGGAILPPFMTTAAPIMLNQWQHVAVTVSRTMGTPEVTFYHNGTAYPATPTGPVPLGLLHWTNSNGRMDIGHGPSLNNSGCCFTNEYFSGLIDEVQIFERSLELTEILAIYNAEEKGKCRSYCHLPKLIFCPNDATRTFTFNIYNESNNPVTYYWGIGSSPADCPSGVVSNTTTPFGFVSSSPSSVTVPGGSSLPITVVANKDPSFGVGDIACYSAWVLDPITGDMFFCRGSIHGVSSLYCPYADPYQWPVVDLHVDSTAILEFPVTNTGDPTGAFDYQIGVIPSCACDTFVIDSNVFLSLNGLPFGDEVIGETYIPPNDTQSIMVEVQLSEFKAFSFQEVVLRADWDDDGMMTNGPTIAIHPALLVDCNNNGVEDSVDIALMTSPDTNGNAIPDECEPYVWLEYCYYCGDANGDIAINVGDAVYMINYVFKGGTAPSQMPAGDANGDCTLNVGDAVFLINYVFKGGDPPICDDMCTWPD